MASRQTSLDQFFRTETQSNPETSRPNQAARDAISSDNGVEDLFDRLFRRTGNTATQPHTSSIPVLDPALANPRNEPIIDPALATSRAPHPVVSKLIADIRLRDSAIDKRDLTVQDQRAGASTIGVERLLTGDDRPDTVARENNLDHIPASRSASIVEIENTG